MAGLSSDLNSYLSKSSSSASLSSLTSKLSSIKLPSSLKTPFGGGDGGQEDEEPFLGVVSDSSGGSNNNRRDNQSWCARKLEENLPSLSKKQRIIGFMASLLLGIIIKGILYLYNISCSGTICFGLAVSFLPLLVINPRKFSLLFTLGSVFTLSR